MTSGQPLFLGVDGGQSSTEALVADEKGRILGRGVAGPCNHAASLSECVQRACAGANLAFDSVIFEGACLGFSGDAADKAGPVRAVVRSERYKLTHDAEIALSGALDGEPGIIVIAGTGSMAFGKDATGKMARAGGWGYVFGDEGGAFDIARRALRAALRMEEGWGPATSLRELLLKQTTAPDANTLLHWFYTPRFPRPEIAALARIVDTAAEDGDLVATRVLHESANELAQFAGGAHRNLFAGAGVPVTYSGGVFESRILLAQFTDAINSLLCCPVFPPRRTPAEGAVLEALRLADRTGPR